MGLLGNGIGVGAAIGLVWAIRKWREIQWEGCVSKNRLDGKVVVLTGATSGLGKVMAEDLASRGGTVVLACRNVKAATELVDGIRLKYPDARMDVVELDLSSLDSVKKCADLLLEKYSQINILINNAGVSIPPALEMKTAEGYEINFGVNHLGHFLLTNLLLERIKMSSPSRIVIVSSKLHEQGVMDWDLLNSRKPFPPKAGPNVAYCNSKLANVLFGQKLAKNLKGQGVNVYMVCPGWNYTQLFRYSTVPWYSWLVIFPVALWFMKPPRIGIQSIVQCAVSEETEHETGLFYRDCKVYESQADLNSESADTLWELSCKMCNMDF